MYNRLPALLLFLISVCSLCPRKQTRPRPVRNLLCSTMKPQVVQDFSSAQPKAVEKAVRVAYDVGRPGINFKI